MALPFAYARIEWMALRHRTFGHPRRLHKPDRWFIWTSEDMADARCGKVLDGDFRCIHGAFPDHPSKADATADTSINTPNAAGLMLLC